MALDWFLPRRFSSAKRPLKIRARGPTGGSFVEWELIGTLARLARERDLDVEVEWRLDDSTSLDPQPRPRTGRRTPLSASDS
jgi:hypothetical protein